MKRPNVITQNLAIVLLACSSVWTLVAQGQVREGLAKDLAENWYRTEILIFVRESTESRQAEQWDPLPDLRYPERHRYLLDPKLADRRLEESLAYASTIDPEGTQTLTLPSPIRELQDHDRPDALTVPLDTAASPSPDAFATDATVALDPSQSGDATLEDGALLELDVTSPILSLPYELLNNESLEFRRQARSLRRQGHRVVFHNSWWAKLDEASNTPALIIDRSGDMDSMDWPALQGSLQVYRSRYLHIVLDLWINTLGEYLPEGWLIDAPPLPRPSLIAATLSAQNINPWAPSQVMDETTEQTPELSSSMAVLTVDTESAMAEDQTLSAPEYPWRHAIVHKQTRRMRSGEIHYLDHPVIGVIVKVTPMSDEALPLVAPEQRAFRERHALPIDVMSVEPILDEP